VVTRRKIEMRNTMIFLALALLAGSLVASPMMLSSVYSGIQGFCSSVRSLLPVAAMLMVVLAGVIYAGGQIMGAETRARANVWATACLTGALIAILIVVVAPPVLNAIYGQSNININIC
jgi:hypothetical protein